VIRAVNFFLLFIFALGFWSCTPKRSSRDATVYGILDQPVRTLDPIHSSERYSTTIVSQIYEGLYHYHYLKRPIELRPAIAESLPEISEDGMTYTIRLKKGVMFQDDEAFEGAKGREVLAEDFVYSWKRLADPANRSPGFWIFDGHIKGLNAWRKGISEGTTTYDSPIEGLSATSSHVLKIQLTKPFFQFPYLLAMPFSMVVPKEAVLKYGENFSEHPVGSGPFYLKKWNRKSEIRLSRNVNFRQAVYPSEGTKEDRSLGRLEDAGKPLPLANEVLIRVLSESQPMWLTFMQGNLDFTMLPKENLPLLLQDDQPTRLMIKKSIRIHKYSRSDLVFVAFNMEHPILGKNKKLRQALARAYDTPSALKKIYGGRGILAQGPIPPNLEGYDPKFKNGLSYDLEKAKALLAEAGYPNGKGLPTFDYDMASQNATSRQMGEFFKLQMAKLGVKIKLVSNSFAQFNKKVKSKKVEIFGMGWYADYPDAENFLQLFYSKNISPGSNMSNFRSRKYDKMYEASRAMKPGPEREELYKKMNSFIASETPMFFNIHNQRYLPYYDWLKNYKENSIINDFYRYLRVDSKARSSKKKSF